VTSLDYDYPTEDDLAVIPALAAKLGLVEASA